MEDKKHSLILNAVALLIIFTLSLYSLFDDSGYVPVEAVVVSSIVYKPVTPPATETTTEAPSINKININYATREELMLLDGIGEKKAQAIINYRNEYGYFTDVYSLTKVKGINEDIIRRNLQRITV